MKNSLLLFALLYSISLKAGFITKDEYAKMLYQNPRGIGCDKCHGEDGEGMVMSIYIKNGEEKELKAPRINDIGIKSFLASFEKRSNLMPVYFLTQKEKAYLYYYLSTKLDKKEDDNESR
jgi:uncharacterized protein YebE (UPF0316 family)